MLRRSACALLALGVFSQASLSAEPLIDISPAAHWRLGSRLGYSASMNLTSLQQSAKALALKQLMDAKKASKAPPILPKQLQIAERSTEEISRLFHQEREQRKNAKAEANQEDYFSFSREMMQATVRWRLLSCSNSALESPLLARMTEFWFNHFNVFEDKENVRPYVASYLLHAIRPHAFGKFEDLLIATAQHPAILHAFDQIQNPQNVQNTRNAKRSLLNESYAQTLLQHHSLGSRSEYSAKDVRELARMFTGWSVDVSGGQGFVFRASTHETGPKIFFGKTYGETGQKQGLAALQFLAHHPATARHIAKRLAKFFVADEPSEAIVNQLAQSFIRSQGDIAELMRSLIESPEFWDTRNQLVKTPFDFACSSLAAADNQKDEITINRHIRQAQAYLSTAGQPLHAWPDPEGYKTDAATWLGAEALTRRADFAYILAHSMDEPLFLKAYYSQDARERIAAETSKTMRNGLWLAAPEFMWK